MPTGTLKAGNASRFVIQISSEIISIPGAQADGNLDVVYFKVNFTELVKSCYVAPFGR